MTYIAGILTKRVSSKKSVEAYQNNHNNHIQQLNNQKNINTLSISESGPNSRKNSFAANPFGDRVATNPFHSPFEKTVTNE